MTSANIMSLDDAESALARLTAKPVPSVPDMKNSNLRPPLTPLEKSQEQLEFELRKETGKPITSTAAMKSLDGVCLRSERPPVTRSSRFNANNRTPPRPLSMLVESE